MAEQDCIFSKIVKGEIPAQKVYEDEAVLAFLDINPISDGHTLVIPKQKYEKLDECPAEVLGQLASKLGKIAQAVAAATGCDGYNVLCNNGRAAGQLIDYVHFHIIPRNEGDGVFHRWPHFQYPTGKIEEIAAKIRENIK
ncbi:MAG: HIT family protein [Sedimentisphaerales bacterium]|nr:HIT family protein [Sedimentisphaerales bacterium]